MKLPTIIVSLCLIVAASIGGLGYFAFKQNILQESQKSLTILTDERRRAQQNWSENLSGDVANFGANPTVIAAANAFNTSFALLTDDPERQHQRAYISDNPNPVGERDRLDRAQENVHYNFQHANYHPFFRQIKDGEGYYDIFLFNPEGDLVYSVYKEADYATNLRTGRYSGSGLGQAFAAAI